MDQSSPVFIVHTLDHARAALTAARAFSCVPLLLSTRDYAAVSGAAVFRAMIDTLRNELPDIKFTSALDCADAPGHALAALRSGVDGIVLGGNAEARARIIDMAAQTKCIVYSPDIYEGEVLVIGSVTDAPEACHRFLCAWSERNVQ